MRTRLNRQAVYRYQHELLKAGVGPVIKEYRQRKILHKAALYSTLYPRLGSYQLQTDSMSRRV